MLTEFKTELQALIEASVKEAHPALEQYPSVTLEIPADKVHGELSTNIAMRLTKLAKKDPMSIASGLCDVIQKNLPKSSLKDKIKSVEVKKPGFVNFYFTAGAFADILSDVFKKGKDYGRLAEG